MGPLVSLHLSAILAPLIAPPRANSWTASANLTKRARRRRADEKQPPTIEESGHAVRALRIQALAEDTSMPRVVAVCAAKSQLVEERLEISLPPVS